MKDDDVQGLDHEKATAHEPTGATSHRAGRKAPRVPAWVWSLPCTAFAVLYAVVWPASTAATAPTPLIHVILRWGHSAVWVLLALSFLVRSSTISRSSRIANVLAIAALPAYATFLLTVALTGR